VLSPCGQPAVGYASHKGMTLVVHHIDAAADMVEQQIGSWEPDNAVDLDLFLARLPRLFEAVSTSVGHVASRLGSDFPVDPAVTERLREIASTVAGMSEFAGEAHSIHRSAHARELERIEEPRPGEQMWDVARNQ
jgi:hypothetical protein